MWAGVTFGAGMALILLEYIMAARKKGGVNNTDKQRMFGLFWLSILCALLVGLLVRMSE